MLAQNLLDAEAGEGAQDDRRRRRLWIDDVRAIVTGRTEEQLVGGDALVAIEDRLLTNEPHIHDPHAHSRAFESGGPSHLCEVDEDPREVV